MVVPITRLKAGMQVVRDVVNTNGVVLIAAGAMLSPETIGRLGSWEIQNVEVSSDGAEGDLIDANRALTPELLGAAEQIVNRKFKHVNSSSPTVASIRGLAVRRTAMALLKDNSDRPTS